MKELCQKFDLVDEDYFGLRYVDVEKQRVFNNVTDMILLKCDFIVPDTKFFYYYYGVSVCIM